MQPKLSSSQQVVLIVDDVPANLSLLLHHLRRVNFRVLVAESGISALEQVQHIRPDIILLDVVMPGLTGFETCRRLKADAHTKEIPVVFLTSLTETVDKVRGFAVGGVDYVTKPLDVEEVFARIKTHLSIVNLRRALEERNEHLDKLVHERTETLQEMNESLRKEIGLRTESQREKEKLFDIAQTQSAQLHSLVNWLTAQQSMARDQMFNALYAPVRSALESSLVTLGELIMLEGPIEGEQLRMVRGVLQDGVRYLEQFSAELHATTQEPDDNTLDRLTAREREILQFLANGATSNEIASELNIADVTVRTYRGRIMKKLNLHHMPGLVKFAIRHGLSSL
ncbi:MAG: response regulator [Candidatus Promineifilaceae bacterium]